MLPLRVPRQGIRWSPASTVFLAWTLIWFAKGWRCGSCTDRTREEGKWVERLPHPPLSLSSNLRGFGGRYIAQPQTAAHQKMRSGSQERPRKGGSQRSLKLLCDLCTEYRFSTVCGAVVTSSHADWCSFSGPPSRRRRLARAVPGDGRRGRRVADPRTALHHGRSCRAVLLLGWLQGNLCSVRLHDRDHGFDCAGCTDPAAALSAAAHHPRASAGAP